MNIPYSITCPKCRARPHTMCRSLKKRYVAGRGWLAKGTTLNYTHPERWGGNYPNADMYDPRIDPSKIKVVAPGYLAPGYYVGTLDIREGQLYFTNIQPMEQPHG